MSQCEDQLEKLEDTSAVALYTDPAQQPQAARARLHRAELEQISTNASSDRGQAALLAGARERRAQTEVPRLHVLSTELTGDKTTMDFEQWFSSFSGAAQATPARSKL